MKIKEKLGTFPIPAWLYALVTVLYCETLLHLWVMDSFVPGRFGAVMAFGLGFGCVLAQVVSFFAGKRWGKWVAAALVGAVSAMYVIEFFISDAYVTFMTMETLLDGAMGVATDYADVVISLVIRDFWRILLILLPTIVYALLAKPMKTAWSIRWVCMVLVVAGYLGGLAIVKNVGLDTPRLSDAYNFDSAIRCFGLNMGFTLDAMQDAGPDSTGEFVAVETPPVVEETQPVQQEQEPVSYETNVMAFDFGALAEGEKNIRIRNIHKYLATVQPTYQNEYTGLFEGKNLIIITAEAFAAEVIDPELTPTLYRLATKGIQFKDYYQPMWGGSTSSGEFSILTGLVSASGTNSIKEANQQELFLSIGKQLQNRGYYSIAYHNHLYNFYDRHKTHTAYGYDSFIGMNNGMEEGVVEQWPESDKEMMDFTVQQYIDKQPFSVYYMTVSGHCRYNRLGNAMSKKNIDLVEHLDASNTVKAYLACQLELEFALESLVRQLEEAGIADDTVIVLSTDHYPYGLEGSSTWGNDRDYIAELYGYDPKNQLERDHNALIIWSGCIEDRNIVVEDPVYSLDVLPTLSNLFGLTFDSRLIVGRDVFSDAEPIVLWYDYTWKTDKGIYIPETMTFTPNEGVQVDEGYVERIKSIVYNKVYYSREAQNTDYFNYLWKEMQTWQ